MFKLFRFVGKYWKFCLIAPLIMIGEVIADLFQPTLMATIIDQGVANGDIPLILTTGLKMLGISLLGAVCGMGCTIMSGIASMGFGTNLRSAIFNKVQTFSFKEIDQFKTSSLITRLTNDITQIQNMLRMGLSMVVRTPFLCIGGIVMSASISPKLSLIFVVAMPLIFALSSITMKRANPLFKVMQKKIDRVNTVMRENLLGMKVVKAFVGQERERERFGEANEDLMSSSMKAMFTISMMWPIVSLFMGMAIVALFWFGGNLVIVGELESGQIMAFMSYMMQALFSLMSVAMIAMNFSRAEASAQRLNEVLETESSIVDPASPKPYKEISVEFENVFFRYNESDPGYVLKNINFKAEKGETVGIIGGTGSGKSTFISLIPRLYDVTKGAVKIGGIDVRDMSIDDLREHIGVVLQESVLFYGSVEENLRW
ncbi:MAG: ABC transporter ATP-binding protein, partial [Clostridia bacterium]|nr:ABC transporter ATP-binding protein [Clostridia bacterium]